MPQRWYGTPIEARVRLDPFAQGYSGGSTPFFLSPLLSIYLLFPYFMLTLILSYNHWYHLTTRIIYVHARNISDLIYLCYTFTCVSCHPFIHITYIQYLTWHLVHAPRSTNGRGEQTSGYYILPSYSHSTYCGHRCSTPPFSELNPL